MNKSQKIVLENLKAVYTYTWLPEDTKMTALPSIFKVLIDYKNHNSSKEFAKAYENLSDKEEAKVLIKFGKWVLKNE